MTHVQVTTLLRHSSQDRRIYSVNVDIYVKSNSSSLKAAVALRLLDRLTPPRENRIFPQMVTCALSPAPSLLNNSWFSPGLDPPFAIATI